MTFELRERHHHTLFTDQMALHILELAKFKKTVQQLTTALDRWLYFLRHAEELDADALPEPLNVPEVRWAMGDLIMISQSERDRELYESRLKMRRDMNAVRAEEREAGRVEGRIEGQLRRIQSLQRLLRQQISSDEELKCHDFSVLEGLAVQLEDQLQAKIANGA